MRSVLPVIVLAQFGCTSLWFAGNAILPDLARTAQLPADFLAPPDQCRAAGVPCRHAGVLPYWPFPIGFLLRGYFLLVHLWLRCLTWALVSVGYQRQVCWGYGFGTGFLLAGIYPVGMKIASDYYQRGLGVSLGFSGWRSGVGNGFSALVAQPHQYIALQVGYLRHLVAGGVGRGGYAVTRSGRPPTGRRAWWHRATHPSKTPFLAGFRESGFRAAALGYFGHMWELYAFWAFVPLVFNHVFLGSTRWWSCLCRSCRFLIIASGSLGCVAGGYLSLRVGAKRVAVVALSLSGLCCLASPLVLGGSSPALLIGFLLVWGVVVVADSPLFSTLVAQNAPAASRGTALTLVNCIGFAITIVSIQLLNLLQVSINASWLYVVLAIGPAIGVTVLLKKMVKFGHAFRYSRPPRYAPARPRNGRGSSSSASFHNLRPEFSQRAAGTVYLYPCQQPHP